MAFDAFLGKDDSQRRPPRWRRLVYALSIVLHAVVLVAGAVHSFWQVDELSPRGVAVTFVTTRLAVPPPPPPPPAAKQAVAQKKPTTPVVRPKAPEIVQPSETPPVEAPAPEAPEAHEASDEASGEDETTAEGEAGGVEGGVAGGVAGGVVAEAPPPKPVEAKPVFLPPSVGSGQRISDINDPRYRPTLPPILNHAGITFRGLFRICVSVDGRVDDVKVLKSADPTVDGEWATVIKRWEYRPFTLNGRPTPFCHPLTVEVRSI